MEKCDIHKTVVALINKYEENIKDNNIESDVHDLNHKDLDELLKYNLKNACVISNVDLENIQNLPLNRLKNNYKIDNNESIRWKYVMFSLHVLLSIKKSENDLQNILSVSQTKNIRNLIEIIISIALLPNLIKGIGITLEVRSKHAKNLPVEKVSQMDSYVRLRTCTLGLLYCNEHPELRKIIVNHHLIDLLAALCQLSFTPLKKPNSSDKPGSSDNFEMTQELWEQLQGDKTLFKKEFETLIQSYYQPLVVKNLMMLIGVKNPPAPNFLKKVIVKYLSDLLMKKDGVLSLVRALFMSNAVDMGKQWKDLEVLANLIIDIGKQNQTSDYYDHVCEQIIKMINITVKDDKNKHSLYIVLPRILMKKLSESNVHLFKEKILNKLTLSLDKCAETNDTENEIVVKEDDFKLCIDKLHMLFILEINSNASLPLYHLLSYVQIFFQVHVVLYKTDFSDLKQKILEITVKIMSLFNKKKLFDLFDIILSNKESSYFLKFSDSLDIIKTQTGIEIKSIDGIKLKKSLYQENMNCLLEIISRINTDAEVEIFLYLLNKITNMYNCDTTTKNDLLEFENGEMINSITQVRLTCLENLEKLAEKKHVIKKLQDNPEPLINFMKKLIENNSNKNTDTYEESEYIFVVLMVMDIVIENISKNTTLQSEVKEILTGINNMTKQSSNDELKLKVAEVIDTVENGYSKTSNKNNEEKIPSELDNALNDICDPLLPVRAHGMMLLTKLIERKDPEAYSRKQFLLCIFQENLKHEDSYIYLTAINGIAALAYAHPDTVVNVLTEEYMNPKLREGDEKQQMRINFGEILVRVTKSLGEMAPKYKSLLLNAFLCGTQDEDPLIRASSLSNLAEACQILGFKLGNMITEILCCIDSIIETEKVVEVRRAAVLVIRQLFKGLGNETLILLKNEILPIYRTLKDIYRNDKDDVTRLHAQIALEELNSITRDFLLPQRKLEMNINIFDIKK